MMQGDNWDRASGPQCGRRGESGVPAEFMKAVDAKRMTDKARALDGDYKRQETADILAKISAAALKGADAIIMPGMSMDKIIEQRLISLGYNVRKDGGDQRDPRDCGSTTVSWG